MSPLGWWLLRQLAAALRLLLAAVIALIVWATPRIWRGAFRAVDAVEAAALAARRRWDHRHDAVVVQELPDLRRRALPAAPAEDLRWSTISASKGSPR